MAGRLGKQQIALFAYLMYTALGILQTLGLYYIFYLPWVPAILDSVVTYSILALFIWVAARTLPQRTTAIVKLFWIVVQGFALGYSAVWLCGEVLLYIYSHNIDYQAFWEFAFWPRILLGSVLLSMGSLIHILSLQISEEERAKEMTEYNEALKKEAELFKLRQQLNPHFLFNSLNSISALMSSQTQVARQMIRNLSNFLRSMLAKEDYTATTVAAELQDLGLYLSVEQVRFGHRLQVQQQVADGCEAMEVPPFLFQPLVENAIKFGLYGTLGAVIIRISISCEGDTVIFQISNPNDPSAVLPKGTGFGLSSVRRRLYLIYNRDDLLHTLATKDAAGNDEYCVKLSLPKYHHTYDHITHR